jgi:hypothetical protein
MQRQHYLPIPYLSIWSRACPVIENYLMLSNSLGVTTRYHKIFIELLFFPYLFVSFLPIFCQEKSDVFFPTPSHS